MTCLLFSEYLQSPRMELGRPELREHEGGPGQRVDRTAGEGGRRQGRGGKE